jgi:hypothetical protein
VSEAEAPAAKPTLSRLSLAAFVVLIGGLAFLVAGTHNENEAPFTALQAHPKLVGLRVVTPADATGSNIAAALRGFGGSGDGNIGVSGDRHSQYVVGRVDVEDLSAPDATYQVIVVDDRLHRVVPHTFGYPAPQPGSGTGQGWDAADDSLHDRFDWQPSSRDQAAFFTAGTVTAFRFVARLPGASSPVTDPGADLSVVLALTHGSDHVYWAVKLDPNGSTPQQSQ